MGCCGSGFSIGQKTPFTYNFNFTTNLKKIYQIMESTNKPTNAPLKDAPIVKDAAKAKDVPTDQKDYKGLKAHEETLLASGINTNVIAVLDNGDATAPLSLDALHDVLINHFIAEAKTSGLTADAVYLKLEQVDYVHADIMEDEVSEFSKKLKATLKKSIQ